MENWDIALRNFSKMVLPIDPSAFVFGAQYVFMYMAIGYLIGSIPFGVIIARIYGKGDPRVAGSGNIGASNMMRTVGALPALLTLLGDAGKGAVATWYSADYGPDIMAAGAIGALLGHLFPVWLKFRGGKGVAVFFGSVAVVAPWVGLIAGVIWLIAFFALRYSSVASLLAVLVVPAVFQYNFDESSARLFLFFAVVIWLTHIGNIRRLIRGTENRYSFGKS